MLRSPVGVNRAVTYGNEVRLAALNKLNIALADQETM